MIRQDEELDKLEDDLRVVKFRYDQFFGGFSKLPPMQERRNIEAAFHEIAKQKMRDNTRRFRFNTLLTRYNQFREMWSRKMREREEGPTDFRRRQALMSAPVPAPAPSAPPPPPSTRVTSGATDPYVRVAQGADGDAIRRIFEQVENEHLKMGKLPPMNAEQLGEMIRKQADSLRERYHVDEVAFRVETVDGKVKLKARPVQEKP